MIRLRNIFSGVALSVALGLSAQTATAADNPSDAAAIRRLVQDMQDAWNRGDFRGYMAGFKNPDITFVSNGVIQRNWQATLDHYVRDYGTPAKRGVVRFYDVSVQMLAPDAAMLVSHFHMSRKDKPLEGVFTDLARKVDGRWIITLNHVSAHDAPR
jgi:uncharacterized protein (TIGR02246 family)